MSKKYYWLKLKEDFFRQKEIKKLRRIAGGDTYTIIYLKLQLLSLKKEGVLVYEGTEESFIEQLSLEIDEDVDNIKMTLSFLVANKLLEEVQEDVFSLTKVTECIGKESASTSRVRKHRAKKQLEGQTPLQCNAPVTNSNTEIEKELELDKEIDIEKDKDNKSTASDSLSEKIKSNVDVFKVVEKCNFILSANNLEQLAEDIKQYSAVEVITAAKIADENGVHNYRYLKAVLERRRNDGGSKRNNKKVAARTEENEIKYDYSKFEQPTSNEVTDIETDY